MGTKKHRPHAVIFICEYVTNNATRSIHKIHFCFCKFNFISLLFIFFFFDLHFLSALLVIAYFHFISYCLVILLLFRFSGCRIRFFFCFFGSMLYYLLNVNRIISVFSYFLTLQIEISNDLQTWETGWLLVFVVERAILLISATVTSLEPFF